MCTPKYEAPPKPAVRQPASQPERSARGRSDEDLQKRRRGYSALIGKPTSALQPVTTTATLGG